MKTDMLIIGSGIAGLTAALTLAEQGSDVLIVTKASLLESSSRYAQAGIAAVRNLRWDSPTEHAADTLTAGCGLNNKRAVNFLVREAPLAVDWLTSLGVRFAKEPTREAAHSRSRIWHTNDSTGESIEKVLAKTVRKHPKIDLLTDTQLLDLAVTKKVCHGAIVRTGRNIYAIQTRQVVLATGGYGQLYARSTNPAVSVGDGLAAAHRAGAKLQDLEFVQFHPTALVGHKIRLTLLSESLRGEGAVLRNHRGERFMTAHHPAAELAPRDVVSRAIFAELKNGPVYLDFTRADTRWLRSRFPFIWKEVQKAGLNLGKDMIPIQPVAHYACGGIAADLHGRTNIQGLLAIGEVAATGVHGANRLASNSLAEAVVWGRHVHTQLPTANKQKISIPKYIFNTAEDRAVLKKVRDAMWQHVGIVRSAAGLNNMQDILKQLKPKSLPAQNATLLAQLVTMQALKRKKSIGTHCRVD